MKTHIQKARKVTFWLLLVASLTFNMLCLVVILWPAPQQATPCQDETCQEPAVLLFAEETEERTTYDSL